MDPEQDIGEGADGPQLGGRRHAAGAGLGLVGLVFGFSIFAVSILIGLYLWHAERNFLWFAATATIGWVASFVLRRMSLR